MLSVIVMEMKRIALVSTWLLLIGTGCVQPVTSSSDDSTNRYDSSTAVSISPEEFFAARMKNTLSIKANHQLFEIIKETDSHVFAGCISQRDRQEKRSRYRKIVKCDLRQLEEEFPLFRTFTSRKAGKIKNTEHAKYDPFVVNKYQHLRRRKQVAGTDLDETHMIFTTSYEYSGNHGPWRKFRMVVRINKTDIANVSSEQIE